MDPTIHERLARVETRLDGIERSQSEMAADLRTVRDHVIGSRASAAVRGRAAARVFAGLGVLGGLWTAFGNYFHLRP